jgi:toxin YoeB
VKVQFTENGWTDFQHWHDSDAAMVRRIMLLLKDALRDPRRGLGKPELLRGNLSGLWSRRITQEHRLVYRVVGEVLEVMSCRYHYRR